MTQDPAGLQEPFWRLAPAAGQVAATDVGTAGLRPQPPLLRGEGDGPLAPRCPRPWQGRAGTARKAGEESGPRSLGTRDSAEGLGAARVPRLSHRSLSAPLGFKEACHPGYKKLQLSGDPGPILIAGPGR